MDLNRYSDRDPSSIARSTPDHWVLFLIEGVALILLGLLAVAIPSIANENVTGILGWLFLLSGATGLVTTYWARQAPGFLWSLVSALLAIFVGVVLIENKSQDLYGGLLGWPFHDTGPLRLILVLFFLVEGGVSIMFGMEHRRHFSTRWAFIFASGVVDIVLASIIIFATLWGLFLKEWRGTSRRTKILVATGLFLLVSSTVVVGYGNYLKANEAPTTTVTH